MSTRLTDGERITGSDRATSRGWRRLPLGSDDDNDEGKNTTVTLVGGPQPVSQASPTPSQSVHIPPMVTVLLVFAALSQSFSSTSVSLFINKDLGYGPVEVVRYWMFVGYTSWFQPLVGIISDMFVVFQERRRPLFVVCGVLNAILYSVVCAAPQATGDYAVFVGISILTSLCTMGIYIPLNGLLVEVGRTEEETQEESVSRVSAVMAKAMVYRSLGSFAGALLHTGLVALFSVRTTLGVSALSFAVLLPLVLATPRHLFFRDAARQEGLYTRVRQTCVTVRRSFDIRDCRSEGVSFLLVLLFVFVYTLMPDAGSVYGNYLYNAFSFAAWFYSLNGCIGFLGSILGAHVFSVWMEYRAKKESMSKGVHTSLFFIFAVGCVAWAFAYVTNLLLCTGVVVDVLRIPASFYIPVDNFFTSMFVRFAFMPTIIMAAERAPKNFEATAFEVFSVASMVGGTLSSLLTSFIAEGLHITRTDYSALWALLLISIASKLVPIPLAYFLPERRRSVNLAAAREVAGDDGEEMTPRASPRGVSYDDNDVPGEGIVIRWEEMKGAEKLSAKEESTQRTPVR